MGSMSIVYHPFHNTHLMGSPGHINYHVEAHSSYVGNRGVYFGYQESAPSGYLGRN